jgi:hypothetical protein
MVRAMERTLREWWWHLFTIVMAFWRGARGLPWPTGHWPWPIFRHAFDAGRRVTRRPSASGNRKP